jgi:uncharacterized membrane protein YjjP (DUF1212 family)
MLTRVNLIYDFLTAPYVSVEKSQDYLTRLTALFMLVMLCLLLLPLLFGYGGSSGQNMILNSHFVCVLGVYFLARFGKLKIASELLVWFSVISPVIMAYK